MATTHTRATGGSVPLVRMIPSSRPVVGRDLEEIKQQFGLSTADACFLFGISITKWTHIVRQGADVPLTDPTLALLVRFLAEHPELSVIPQMPTAAEMFELFNEVLDVDQKRFSLMLGAEASAGYRWRKANSRQSAALQRLMYYMRLALMSRSSSDRLQLLDGWSRTVASEGAARGVDDIFRAGQWLPREVIEKSKQSIGARAGQAKTQRERAKEGKPKRASLRKNIA